MVFPGADYYLSCIVHQLIILSINLLKILSIKWVQSSSELFISILERGIATWNCLQRHIQEAEFDVELGGFWQQVQLLQQQFTQLSSPLRRYWHQVVTSGESDSPRTTQKVTIFKKISMQELRFQTLMEIAPWRFSWLALHHRKSLRSSKSFGGKKLKLVAVKLTKHALLWWKNLKRFRARERWTQIKTWEKMKRKHKKFSPKYYQQETT